VHVDGIEQRTGDARAVLAHLVRRAAIASKRIPKKSAGTGIHCGDQLKAGWKFRLARRPRDRNGAGLERFAQDFEDAPVEFRQFVEEQHAMVRERYFARARVTAADQGHRRSGMMRRPERTVFPPAWGKSFVQRLDRGGFESLVVGERRQDTG